MSLELPRGREGITVYVILVGLLFILLAGLIARPMSPKTGVGGVVGFALLSIVGAVALMVMYGQDVFPPTPKDKADAAIAVMTERFEEEAGLVVVEAPTHGDIKNAGVPHVWNFADNQQLICVAEDFPKSAALNCFVPAGQIGAGVEVDFDKAGH